MSRQSWAVVLAVFSITVSELSAFDYEAYRPYRLADVIKENSGARAGDWNIVGADSSYRVSVTFSGDLRKVDPKHSMLIDMWVKSVGLDPKSARQFTQEVRVLERGTSYWLPIQKVLVEPLKSEVSAGQQVDLYVAWIGSTKLDFIFLVNEFDAARPAK